MPTATEIAVLVWLFDDRYHFRMISQWRNERIVLKHAKTFAESDLRGGVKGLIAKHQHVVLNKCVSDFCNHLIG